MMMTLLLAGVEKMVNFAISSDKITQAGLTPLSSKVLRLKMNNPSLQLDVLFNDDHIRFEPVGSSDMFESNFKSNADPTDISQPNDSYIHPTTALNQPDCTIHVASPLALMNLLKNPEGNLPIAGDYKVLMQVRQLIAGFDPNIATQLAPIIGVPLSSQLTLLIKQLSGNWTHTAKQAFNEATDWANQVAGNSEDPLLREEINDLQQQLLKLRADVEREQAKLDAIKAEQQHLKS